MYIFALPDHMLTPHDWPQQVYKDLIAIGRLYLEDHRMTRIIWDAAHDLGIDINPFEDSRLNSTQLAALRELISSLESKQTSIPTQELQRIKEIVFHPIPIGYGLISFAD